jgi:hypothetical protein
MRTPFVAFLLVVVTITVVVPEAGAIPLFARKYNTTCFTCHTTEPLLNEFGRRFQANGFQLPGTSEKFAQADQSIFAFGILATPMVSHTQTHDNILDTTTGIQNTFSGIEVGLFSSASLGSHFSYFAAVPVKIANGKTDISVEAAHLIYSDVLSDGTGSLNFRLGKFRIFSGFLKNVLLTGADPLVDVYNPLAGKTANDLLVSNDPTFGVSAYGTLYAISEGLRWEVGATGGTNSDVDLNTARAVFGSLDQTLYLNNAPVRFGGFLYRGIQDITDIQTILKVTDTAIFSNHVSRAGVDAEIFDPWTKRFDFFGEYSIGKDDKVDRAGSAYNMTGGFAGVNVILFPEKFYIYGRYDWMNRKETSDNQHQIDLGFHYHLLPNVVFTGVYTVLMDTRPPDGVDLTTTTFGAGILFGF